MQKNYRSLLFIPAIEDRYYSSAVGYKPDCIILDLEDSISEDSKDSAKAILREKLLKGFNNDIDTFIRINLSTMEKAKKDISDTIDLGIYGYMLPKIESIKEVYEIINHMEYLENKLSIKKKLSIIILIETPRAILNIKELADSSERVLGLGFGGEDYISFVGGKRTKDSLLYPRYQILLSAKANNIQCFDTVFINLGDKTGYTNDAIHAAELGYTGKLLIHPSQVTEANTIFGYSEAELSEMSTIIESYNEYIKNSGKGVFKYNGKIFEKPHVDRFTQIVSQYKGN